MPTEVRGGHDHGPGWDPTDFRHVQRSRDVVRWFIHRNHAPDADELFSAWVRVGRMPAVAAQDTDVGATSGAWRRYAALRPTSSNQ